MGSLHRAVVVVSLAALAICGCQGQSPSGGRQPAQQSAQVPEENHFQKALDCEAQQQWELAKQEYRLAVKQQPQDSRACVNLGRLYAREGESAHAEECWRQALRINPKDARAANLLGSVYMRQKQFDKAITCYGKALEADPNYANAHWNIAAAYRSLDRKREAAQHYRKYIDLAPPEDLEGIVEARRYMDSLAEK